MKNKVKKGIVITILAIVAFCILFVLWFYFFGNVNLKRRHKKLFDKAFDGDYKLTCTESVTEWGYAPFIGVKLPTRCKEYLIEYTDHKGTQRKVKLPSEPYNLYDYPLSYYSKANDWVMVEYLSDEECYISLIDLFDDVFKKYFDCETPVFEEWANLCYHYYGEGYDMWVFCQDNKFIAWSPDDYIKYRKGTDTRNMIDKHWCVYEEAIDPQNRKSLCSYSLKDFAEDTTKVIKVKINVDDDSLSKEELAEKADEYAEKLEKAMEEYEALSDSSVNYRCCVDYLYTTDEPDEEEYERKLNAGEIKEGEMVYKKARENVSYKCVVFGEDITDEVKDEEDARDRFNNQFIEKNGWDMKYYTDDKV